MPKPPHIQASWFHEGVQNTEAPAAMQPFLNAYPVANGAPAGPGLAQFNASYSNPSSLDAYSIRVDQVVGSKLNLFGRYNYSPSGVNQRAAPFTTPALSTIDLISSSVHTFTVGLTALITPAISNEVRANYSNHRVATDFIVDSFGGAVPLPDSLLFPAGTASSNSAFLLLISGVGEQILVVLYPRPGTDARAKLDLLRVIGTQSLTSS